MRLRTVDVGLHPSDLRFEGFDAGVEFLDRNGVEILFCKLRQRVARLAREEILKVHWGIVDLLGRAVNKRGECPAQCLLR